jgi:Ca2+-binding RTX toxin-like protein
MRLLWTAIVGLLLAVLMGMAAPVWASDDENEVKGTLSAVDTTSRTVTVNGQTYSVSAQVNVEVNDTHIPFGQLASYVGKQVELKLNSENIAFKIEVKGGGGGNGGGGQRERKGTLNSVDTDNLIVTANNQKFVISEQVIVEVDNLGHIAFDQLDQYIGRFVELKLNVSNVVTKIEVSNGTSDDDDLDGSDDDDDLNGGDGDDHINGGSGDDTIDGGNGNDDLDGGNGDDHLNGGSGNDILRGGNGKDTLNGDDDQPTALVPAMVHPLAKPVRVSSNDILDGGAGDDTINGGVGNDQIVGGLGKDAINAGEGNDTIWISIGDVPAGQTESINCGAGRDLVNLRNFPKRTRVTGGKLTDPTTGGVYQFANCERFVQTRSAPPRTVAASEVSSNQLEQGANLTLQVFTLQGQKIFQSELPTASVTDSLVSARAIMTNGVYLYVVSVRSADGEVLSSEIKKFFILQ